MKTKLASLFLSLALVVSLIAPAQASATPKWNHTPGTTLGIPYAWDSSITFTWDTAFRSAVSDWNATNTRVWYYHSSTAKTKFGVVNIPGGAYGYFSAYTQDGTQNTYMTHFHASGNEATTGSFTANMRRSTSNHELGHGVSLADRQTGTSIMNVFRDRSIIYTPKTSDVNNVNILYP